MGISTKKVPEIDHPSTGVRPKRDAKCLYTLDPYVKALLFWTKVLPNHLSTVLLCFTPAELNCNFYMAQKK